MKKIGENFSFVLLKLGRGKVRPIIREENLAGARNRPGLEPEGRILKRYMIRELFKVRKKMFGNLRCISGRIGPFYTL